MSPTLTLPYDAAAYLRTEEDCALYLQAVTEEANGDARLLDIALADIARARSRFDIAANSHGSNTSA